MTFAIVQISASVMTVAITSGALAQDSFPVGSHPSTYIPATPIAAQEKVVEPAAAEAEPGRAPQAWDGDKPFDPALHAPKFAEPKFPLEMLNGFRGPAMAAFDLTDLSVQEARVASQNADTLVRIRLEAHDRVVRLQPHTLRSPDAKLMIDRGGGVLIEEAWPEPATYRGIVEGVPHLEAAASIRDGQVSMLLLSSDAQKPSWIVQPLSDALPGMPLELHIVYRDIDVPSRNAHCGWNDANPAMPVVPAPNQPQPEGPNLMQRIKNHAPERTPVLLTSKQESETGDDGGLAGGDGGSLAVANVRCQIGLDADVEFFQANGSSFVNTVYDMELIMNQVGLIYQNQVQIAYTTSVVFVRTAEPDPYTSTNANTLLCQFGEWWNGNVTTVRDVGHLFTGKDLDGTTVGLAWIGSICVTNFNNCNANGSNLSYGLVQSRFAPDLASRTCDSAHELGHNWNACHCNTGGNCGGGTSNPACGIMTSNINTNLNFDAAAVTAITTYRDGRPCLDVWQNPTYVNWAYVGPETGSSAQPWNTIFEGLDACLVGGTLNVAAGNYFQNPNIFKAKNIFPTGGTVRIGN